MDASRITGRKTNISEKSVHDLYAERANSRKAVDVDAPVVLASDESPDVIRKWNEYEVTNWLPKLRLDENSNVLEVGFGTGRIAKYIIEKAGSYTGVDYVEEFVQLVKDRTDIHPGYAKDPVFLCGSFRDLSDGKISLPLEKYNRFVISGGVLMYINDSDAKHCIEGLPKYLSDDAVIYISEPVGISERLTLDGFYAETMKAQYSAIYRTEDEYKELFAPLFDAGFSLKTSEEFFKDDIKGRKETRQWMFVMEK